MIDWSKGLIDLSNVRLFVVGVISIIKSESIIFATSLTNTFWSELYYCSVLEQHVFTSDLWNHSAYILSFCTPSFVFGHPEHLGHISHTKNSPRPEVFRMRVWGLIRTTAAFYFATNKEH